MGADPSEWDLEMYAEKLREEGRAEARAEARAKAREEGYREGRREVLVRQLEHLFGELPRTVCDRVNVASDVEVARWLDRVFSAESLDELLAD